MCNLLEARNAISRPEKRAEKTTVKKIIINWLI